MPVLGKPRNPRRRKPTLKQALAQAQAAGAAVRAVDIRPDGSVRFELSEPDNPQSSITNEWDEVYGKRDS